MNCRSCGSSRFEEVIDLGHMPLVNDLLTSQDQPAPTYPLRVVLCMDCALAQLTHSAPPSKLFDQYVYFSSQSQTMVDHAQWLVNRFVRSGDRVLEIASNDGYLLMHAIRAGATVLGVEPARNLADHANAQGVPSLNRYFNRTTAEIIRDEWGKADVIFANNVLAHVPDPNEIVAGIDVLLASDGSAHVEVPSFARLLEATAFDTIYHEHYSYFSAISLFNLFAHHGLKITGIEEIDIHGGSFHLTIRRHGDESQITRQIQDDMRAGVRNPVMFTSFSNRVRTLHADLQRTLDQYDYLAAMGAAAKGVVLMNAFRLTTDRVRWVADVSPHKQGRFVPGTLQPIVSPEHLLSEMPDAALLLPWNIRDELIHRHRRYLDQGGRFIVPIPRVEVIAS